MSVSFFAFSLESSGLLRTHTMTRRLGRVLCSEGLSEFLSVEPPKGLETGRGSSGGSLGFAKSDLEIAREKLTQNTN